MSEPRRHRTHYEKLPRWGTPRDAANRERVAVTQDLIGDVTGPVLDVGCGDGMVTNELARRGVDVTGVDISVRALRLFRGAPVVASLDRLPFRDLAFETSVCAEVLEHLPDPSYRDAEREIERVTRRRVVATTPNREHLPGGVIRCARCGARFHRNLHTRTMDRRAHERLFSAFRSERTVGIATWRPTPLLTWLQQRVFGVYGDGRGAPCPACGHVSPPPPRPKITVRAVLRAAGLVDRILSPERPRWIGTRYARSADHGDAARPTST